MSISRSASVSKYHPMTQPTITENATDSVPNHAMHIGTITVNDILIQVVRKPIKNVHIAVHPPDGQVRVSAPLHLTDDNIRLAVISKLGWIKKQQVSFQSQPRQSQREMLSGESHYLWGRRYRLEVEERWGPHIVNVKNGSRLQLFVQPGTTAPNREEALNRYYRAELKQRIPTLISRWETRIGQSVAEWGIRKMKTKWGSCNIAARRIWLNLELAKKPSECLEYILVHEMVHLLERHHNETFRNHMDQLLPNWRHRRALLNAAPLAYEDWTY